MVRPGINLTLGALIFVVVFTVSALALYGATYIVEPEKKEATAETADGGGGAIGGPTTIRLVAKDLKFDKGSVSAGRGSEVTVVMDNQDAGVLHNVAFYTNNRATQKIYAMDLFPGQGTRQATFAAPASAGSYFFRCDVHPDTMTGRFSVQ